MDTSSLALQPHNVGAAIFDFDGTLADTAALWHEVDWSFFNKRGIVPEPHYAQRLAALGFVEGARYTIETYGLDESVEDVCAEWTETSEHLYKESVTLRPGALEYLRRLAEHGVPCALATTNSASVLESMRHVDVRRLFGECVYGSEVSRGKDHPDIYLEAARRLGVSPESCTVFEDITPALHAAHRAGMTSCGVRSGDANQPVESLRAAADLWIEDWRDLR